MKRLKSKPKQYETPELRILMSMSMCISSGLSAFIPQQHAGKFVKMCGLKVCVCVYVGANYSRVYSHLLPSVPRIDSGFTILINSAFISEVCSSYCVDIKIKAVRVSLSTIVVLQLYFHNWVAITDIFSGFYLTINRCNFTVIHTAFLSFSVNVKSQ